MAATFAELLGDLHRERFVGREAELAAAEQWLADEDAPPILAASGVGGIGKTWLLEELGRRAEARGRVVRRLDAVSALAAGDLDRSVDERSGADAAGTVVVVDAVDALGTAVGELQRHLSSLPVGVRVVLSSRRALRGGAWRSWEPLIRALELGPLTAAEQHRYLDLRGIDDPARREYVLLRTGGHPLTLSLAVDLMVGGAAGEFVESRAWRSTVRMTVEELVAELGDQLRPAVDVAAVLHHVDREALAAVLGAAGADQAFVRLCTWSASRVVGEQLVLHDDVRRAVVEDLRLHAPARLDTIRRTALRHYRRAASVGGDAGLRWSIERLHLVGRDVFGASYLYEEYPNLRVLPATPEDVPEILELRRRIPPVPGVPAVESDPDRLARLLADAHCVTHLARDPDGQLLGFGFYVRLTEGNRRLFGEGDATATAIAAAAEELGCLGGVLPEDSNILYMGAVVAATDHFAPEVVVLANHALTLLAAEGAYLFFPSFPQYLAMTEAMLMTPLCPGLVEQGLELRPRLLDLSRCGVGAWVRAMMAGQELPRIPVGPALSAAVSDAVASFDDDESLAASVLTPLAEPGDEVAEEDRAREVRALLARSLHAAGPWPTPETRIRAALVDAGIASLPEMRDMSEGGAIPGHPAPVSPPRGATRVQVLGRLAVVTEGRARRVPQGAVGVTVALLALRRSVSAEELIDLLWPDVDPPVGRERLRGVLSRVRRSVASDLVVRRGAQVELNETVAVDAETFETAATSALREPPEAPDNLERCAEAVDAYGGELLPGDRYSEWTVAPRERLGRLLLDLLDRLADGAEAAGDVQEAVRWLERAIGTDPYDESRYLRAARLLAGAGRRGRALATLQRARSAAAALGVPVDEKVVRFQRQLRATG